MCSPNSASVGNGDPFTRDRGQVTEGDPFGVTGMAVAEGHVQGKRASASGYQNTAIFRQYLVNDGCLTGRTSVLLTDSSVKKLSKARFHDNTSYFVGEITLS